MPKRKSEVTVSSDTEDVPSTSKKVKKESSSRPTADEGPNGSTSKAVQRKEDAKQQELEAFEQSVESVRILFDLSLHFTMIPITSFRESSRSSE